MTLKEQIRVSAEVMLLRKVNTISQTTLLEIFNDFTNYTYITQAQFQYFQKSLIAGNFLIRLPHKSEQKEKMFKVGWVTIIRMFPEFKEKHDAVFNVKVGK